MGVVSAMGEDRGGCRSSEEDDSHRAAAQGSKTGRRSEMRSVAGTGWPGMNHAGQASSCAMTAGGRTGRESVGRGTRVVDVRGQPCVLGEGKTDAKIRLFLAG